MSNENQFAFGVTSETVSLNKTTMQFPGGVVENVTCTVKFEKLSESKEDEENEKPPVLFLEFTKDENNGKDVITYKNREILWEPKVNEIIKHAASNPTTSNFNDKRYGLQKGDVISPEIVAKKKIDDFNSRIKHILHTFMSEKEAITGAVANYAELAKKVIDKLAAAKASTQKIRVLFTYNEQYTRVRPYGIFMENMKVINSRLVPTSKDQIHQNIPQTRSDMPDMNGGYSGPPMTPSLPPNVNTSGSGSTLPVSPPPPLSN